MYSKTAATSRHAVLIIPFLVLSNVISLSVTKAYVPSFSHQKSAKLANGNSRRREETGFANLFEVRPRLKETSLFSTLNGDGEEPPVVTESSIAQAANDLLTLQQQESATPDSISLPDEISSSFLQYAMSIILGRALPDARDGLKPVHRRILYAMSGLNLQSSSGYRKCARIVGEVLGKFHPHGDTAVYDALVRLAQDFSTGSPLIDGHGNFGSVDGDPAAAMRYTECRLTKIASETLLSEELRMETVEFVDNFDGNEIEPSVLPAKVPVLLLNGCAGIAVGMATNVPPHNLGELLDACILLTEKGAGKVTQEELFEIIPGPDFPTGANIMGKANSRKLYKTGNGGVVIRATHHVEDISKTKQAIIVTELPYQVNKALLLEKIANLVNSKVIDGISDLRDESDRDGIRMVLELKKDANPGVVVNNLYQKTSLQTSFSGNFLALMTQTLTEGVTGSMKPQRFTLKDALVYFLEFRFETIRKKCVFRAKKDGKRKEIVEGMLIALKQVDQVIQTIRTSPDQATAKTSIMEHMGLTQDQADAVLKLQLGQLTRLNKDKLSSELKSLDKSMKDLTNLLTQDDAVSGVMIKEFQELKARFAIPRRTKIIEDEGDLNEIDLITNSRSVITVTHSGYIKRMPLKTFENQRRGTRGKTGTSSSQKTTQDQITHCFTCNDHDTLLITTHSGIAYGLRAYQVPIGARTSRGTPIPTVLPLKRDEIIASILPVSEFRKDSYCVIATERGWIKKTPLAAFENLTSRGLIIASLEEEDKLKWCVKCEDGDDILVGSANGNAIRYAAEKLRPTGRSSRGVRSMKMKEGDVVTDVSVLKKEEGESVLVVTKNGYGKRIRTEDFRSTGRGGVGVIAIKFKKEKAAEDKISCLRVVHEEDEVLLGTSRGVIVRQRVGQIPIQGRAATGVMVQKVDVQGGDVIQSVSIIPEVAEEEFA